MKVHFIAMGGSVMHNLALDMQKKGYQVSGSDDIFYEPSKSRLKDAGLLPEEEGWNASRIKPNLDAVILGMHARVDNPELIRAQQLNLKVYSFPEYMYQNALQKKRVVVAGSHGKTTITSMILHVLKQNHIACDYLVGSQIEGFDRMVCVDENTKIAVYEGDEYFSSPIDKQPKFLHYHPDILIITGIAWDHMNVFPTFAGYCQVFKDLIQALPSTSTLIYNRKDLILEEVIQDAEFKGTLVPYHEHDHMIDGYKTFLLHNRETIPLEVFGAHNLSNLQSAKEVCTRLGVSEADFYSSISTFKGAAKRLELLKKTDDCVVYRDFAHAPSKVKATIEAVKEQYPDKKVLACLELHTFSSLNQEFLPQYNGTMGKADKALVYFDPKVLENKKLPPIAPSFLCHCFEHKNMEIINNAKSLEDWIKKNKLHNSVLLLMSSGDWGGLNINNLSDEYCSHHIHA